MIRMRAARSHPGLIRAALFTTVAAGAAGSPSYAHSPSTPLTRAQPAGAFAYAPGTRRYQLTTVVARAQNQAGGRAPFEFSTTTTMDVTLTLAQHARDTLALTLTIDSVAVTSDLDAPAADISAYKGAKLTGLISPQGRIYRFKPPAHANNPLPSLYRSFH